MNLKQTVIEGMNDLNDRIVEFMKTCNTNKINVKYVGKVNNMKKRLRNFSTSLREDLQRKSIF